MATVLSSPRPSAFARLLQSTWLRPLNDPAAWDRLLSALNPLWSLRGIPARVMQIIDETADTKTFVLRPSRRWPGHLAGQHVVVEVLIDGRYLQRTFSLSSAPGKGQPLQLTVKRHPGGRVSQWLHQHLAVGSVLHLSAPDGKLLAPASAAAPLLLLSAGSGITPLMAILRDLHARAWEGRIVLIHSCRGEADLIFAAELRALAARWEQLTIHVHDSRSAGRLDAAQLTRWLPDYAEHLALVCGPPALTTIVEQLYAQAGVPERVHSESYRGRVLASAGAANLTHTVHCDVTEQVFTAGSADSLLTAAEAAGLRPAHGCRIGICRSCQCTKRSGTVENLRTGELSSEPDELIQLCVSVARSPLELAL